MTILDYIFAITLGILGVYLIYCIGSLMLSAIPSGAMARLRAGNKRGSAKVTQVSSQAASNIQIVTRSKNALDKADEAIDKNDWKTAIKILQKVISVKENFNSREAVESFREQQQNALSRCLVVSEGLGTRLDNLAMVERLIVERGELLTLSIKSSNTFGRLKDKRQQKGKDIPGWSKKEFKQKTTELKKQLLSNQKALQAEWIDVFSCLKESLKKGGVTYH